MCSILLTLDTRTEMSNLTHIHVLVCLVWGQDVSGGAGWGHVGSRHREPELGGGGDAAGPPADSSLSLFPQTALWTCSSSWTPQRALP